MATFQYTAIDASGEEKKGVVDAQDERDAQARVSQQGLKPTGVTAIGGQTATAGGDNARPANPNIPASILKAIFCVGQPSHGFLLAYGILLLLCPQIFFFAFVNLSTDGGFILKMAQSTFVTAIFVVYPIVLIAVAIFHLLRPSVKSLFACLATTVVSAIFFPVTSLVTLAGDYLKKRLHLSLVFLAAAFAIGALSFCSFLPFGWYVACYGYLPIVVPYLLLAVAVMTATKGKPLPYTIGAFVPVVLTIAFMVAFHLQFLSNKAANKSLRNQISKIVGFDISKEGFRKIAESGIGFSKEPLASFMKIEPIESHEFEMIDTGAVHGLDPARHDKLASEFASANRDYEKALLAFTDSKPQKIAHTLDWENEPIASMRLPELSKLRDAASFLMKQIALEPTNRELLIRNNEAMVALRDCALHGDLIISVLVGNAIESFRISALCSTLPYLSFTDEEWDQLLGDEQDGFQLVANAIAMEATGFEDIKDYTLTDLTSNSEKNDLLAWEIKPRFIPKNLIAYLFEFDYGYALGCFKRQIEFLLEDTCDFNKIDKDAEDSEAMARARGYVLTAMLMPAYAKSANTIVRMQDKRRMANLARQVFAYRAKNGAFPESLDAITDDCLDSINHYPFRLETYYNPDLDTRLSMRRVGLGLFTDRNGASNDSISEEGAPEDGDAEDDTMEGVPEDGDGGGESETDEWDFTPMIWAEPLDNDVEKPENIQKDGPYLRISVQDSQELGWNSSNYITIYHGEMPPEASN